MSGKISPGETLVNLHLAVARCRLEDIDKVDNVETVIGQMLVERSITRADIVTVQDDALAIIGKQSLEAYFAFEEYQQKENERKHRESDTVTALQAFINDHIGQEILITQIVDADVPMIRLHDKKPVNTAVGYLSYTGSFYPHTILGFRRKLRFGRKDFTDSTASILRGNSTEPRLAIEFL